MVVMCLPRRWLVRPSPRVRFVVGKDLPRQRFIPGDGSNAERLCVAAPAAGLLVQQRCHPVSHDFNP
jgi:hypothetical protein